MISPRFCLVVVASVWAVHVAHANDEPLPDMDCLLSPYLVVDLGTQVFGVVEAVEVRRGDSVRKGQILARLASGEERAAVDLAVARTEFRKRQLQRNEQLYADELISIHDKDEVLTESVLSELELAVVKQRLAMRSIESPIDGVVVTVDVAPGEYVQEEPLMQLAQVDPISVEVVVACALFRQDRQRKTSDRHAGARG